MQFAHVVAAHDGGSVPQQTIAQSVGRLRDRAPRLRAHDSIGCQAPRPLEVTDRAQRFGTEHPVGWEAGRATLMRARQTELHVKDRVTLVADANALLCCPEVIGHGGGVYRPSRVLPAASSYSMRLTPWPWPASAERAMGPALSWCRAGPVRVCR